MNKPIKWQEDYKKHIENIVASNDFKGLIEEALMSQLPDGYDGEFTDRAIWESRYVLKVLSEMLIQQELISSPLDGAAE